MVLPCQRKASLPRQHVSVREAFEEGLFAVEQGQPYRVRGEAQLLNPRAQVRPGRHRDVPTTLAEGRSERNERLEVPVTGEAGEQHAARLTAPCRTRDITSSAQLDGATPGAGRALIGQKCRLSSVFGLVRRSGVTPIQSMMTRPYRPLLSRLRDTRCRAALHGYAQTPLPLAPDRVTAVKAPSTADCVVAASGRGCGGPLPRVVARTSAGCGHG